MYMVDERLNPHTYTILSLCYCAPAGCIFGSSSRPEKGAPAEVAGSIAAAALIEAMGSGACVDEHMQDQLIIYMALADGVSRMITQEPTLHTRTAMVVAEQLLPAKFTVKAMDAPQEGRKRWMIECKGAGWKGGAG